MLSSEFAGRLLLSATASQQVWPAALWVLHCARRPTAHPFGRQQHTWGSPVQQQQQPATLYPAHDQAAAADSVQSTQQQQQQGPPQSSNSSSSSSTDMQQQAHAAVAGPRNPGLQRGGRLTARRHLQQYLASINSTSYVDDLALGIRAGNRLAISRGLTLCESTRPDHALQAAALLRKLVDQQPAQPGLLQQQQQPPSQQQASSQQQQQQQGPSQLQARSAAVPGTASSSSSQPQPAQSPAAAGQAAGVSTAAPDRQAALRVGVSGPPGAGKSSLIETWGCYLADHGSRVAVLAVDPSSAETGGAILGDKTRMPRLSSHPNAFVRPSPARGTLGGVARATYDAMVICEAAGYDKVLVETVGVGQSEVAVADLVDCMLLVMPPVGGDDLQMIKRGIMEVADALLVNKADGPTEAAALAAASQYASCVHLMPHRYGCWEPQVLPVSAHTGRGVPALARLVGEFQRALGGSGELARCRMRRAEAVAWLSLEEQLLEGLRADKHVAFLMARLMPGVRAGTMAPRSAADIALGYFYQYCS